MTDKMKTFTTFIALSIVLSATGLRAQSTAPYLETVSVTIVAPFYDTGIVTTDTAGKPLPAALPDNPDSLPITDRVLQDSGTIILNPTGSVDRVFFAKQFLRQSKEIYALRALQNASFEVYVKAITKIEDSVIQITGVREPQLSVEGALSAPYQLYVTVIDRTDAGVMQAIPTPFFLRPLHYVTSSSETLAGAAVTRATGNFTIHYSLYMFSRFADDPLSSVELEDGARQTAFNEGEYNKSGTDWTISATGLATGTLRTTIGENPAVTLSKISLSGHGSWLELIFGEEDNTDASAGVMPIKIKIGESKFQRRDLFRVYPQVAL
jgi:hypothetical protein